MNIVMTRTIQTEDGTRWSAGTRLTVTDKELKDRKVPKDAYRVVDDTPKPTPPSDSSASSSD
ncbi:MAG: hypothetical protein AAGF84_03790 [Planctomycetota bacterium]